MEKQTRIYADQNLLNQLRKAYPESKGMTYTGLVDWALRWMLLMSKTEKAMEA